MIVTEMIFAGLAKSSLEDRQNLCTLSVNSVSEMKRRVPNDY